MNTETFTPGQRWISESESELGLGTVLTSGARQVTIVYLSCGETRTYSTETAPLSRVIFNKGDQVESHEGWKLTITEVQNVDDLIIYRGLRADGSTRDLPETSLSNLIQLNSPLDRLLTAQLDENKWFELRADTFNALHNQSQSEIFGLSGARVELIPHQFYIAKEVGSRVSPRVLLADEVGLGKTIEAGLIIHYQLLREQIQRVLVIVPDALVHQWLVEMQRRFNLHFQIMDEEKYLAIKHEDKQINPFSSSQLVLCSLSFLLESTDIQTDVNSAGWDTIVLDEAHHLEWNEYASSEAYSLVEKLATSAPSLLLLTATPEQLGPAGHFARLRLLDNARFSQLSSYIEEGKHYREVAKFADLLHSRCAIDEDQIGKLPLSIGSEFISEDEWLNLHDCDNEQNLQFRRKLLRRLIDTHGTGRILFRNTRSAIHGFPSRHLHQYILPKQTQTIDAILNWLNDFLRQQYPEKCLLICSSTDRVLRLYEGLRVKHGVHGAIFHQDMSIVERDRAAAWFANPEEDCQLLISSEIGSEGRNFQFLHHLILHQLPFNADLLEQRIGRLDRIGQRMDIEIHIPYQADSSDNKLVRWYHEALDAFEKTCSTGSHVTSMLQNRFNNVMENHDIDSQAFQELLDTGKSLSLRKNEELESGRDRLLELNSNQPEVVEKLIEQLREQNTDPLLSHYMMNVFDCFGVEFEEQSNHTWILNPGRHMTVSHFPSIPDGGVTVCFDRHEALAREDIEFITWDHPMVLGAMDLITTNPYGQASLVIIEQKNLPHGALYIESLFRAHCTANSAMNLQRYLPPQALRFVISDSMQDLSKILAVDQIKAIMHPAEKSQTRTFIKTRAADVKLMVAEAQRLAKKRLPELAESARLKIETELGGEINRLCNLKEHNTLIRDDEISGLENRMSELLSALQGVTVQSIAIRVLVNIH